MKIRIRDGIVNYPQELLKSNLNVEYLGVKCPMSFIKILPDDCEIVSESESELLACLKEIVKCDDTLGIVLEPLIQKAREVLSKHTTK